MASVSKDDIEKALKIIDSVRQESKNDVKGYGFGDDWKTFMKRMRLLTTQSSSPRIESYLAKHHNWRKIMPSLDKGDIKDDKGDYYEIKLSTLTTSNQHINILQIRLWQKIKGYKIFVIDALDDYETTYFELTKEQMIDEIEKAPQYSHGTKRVNKQNARKEYSLHIKSSKKDETFQRWNKKYKKDFPIKDAANN